VRTIFFFLLLLSPLGFSLSATAAPATEGLGAVSAGDRARFSGDHAKAKRAYRQAIDSQEPAAEAMARLRLLAYSGNLGGWIHGRGIERALNAAQGPAGELAWVDFHLFAPAFVGASAEEAARLAESLLTVFPAEATARMFLATRDPKWLAALGQLEALDGLGEALLVSGGRLPQPPGSWNLGIGFSGAPGLGVGAGLSFRHTDWGGWSTTAFLGGSSLGTAYAVLRAQSSKTIYLRGNFGGAKGLLYRYVAAEREALWRLRSWAELGPGFHKGPFRVWVGVVARSDEVDQDTQLGHGLLGGLSWDTRRGSGRNRQGFYGLLESESSLWGDYSHWGIFLDLRAFHALAHGVLASRLTHQQAFNPEVPFYRLPVVGGMSLHRGAPISRWRAPWISTVDLEQRWMLGGPIEGVVFVNAAQVSSSGFHPAGGVGVRFILPPEETNVSRLDMAWSDTGWGLYASWGEAF
jgi:hypothetical protein